MQPTDKIMLRIKAYVQDLFQRRNLSFLKYHNLSHTEKVVERSIEIARASADPIDEQSMNSLIIAAWFHDTGHLFNELKEHEQAGADLMAAFLKSFSIDDSIIDEVGRCIMATKFPSYPHTTLEQILCDADTYHFGTKEFFETDHRIYEEFEARLHTEIKGKTEKSIRLLESHQFFTAYCQELLNPGKLENIKQLRSLLG
jgi:predicted metal-dependent HD superfamily phosphohydrolase